VFVIMHLSYLLCAVLAALTSVTDARNVFAHVVVGNTGAHDVKTWGNDIALAKKAGIDAFVLNIAYPDPNTPIQVANAFAAAEAAGGAFKLFFSFDYLGGGQPWAPTSSGDYSTSVVGYLNKYKSSKAYFNYQNKTFVSTFEGVTAVADWAPGGPIRSQADVYFVPDWSSLGTSGIKADLDNIDGFFSWDMWPNGATNKTADGDKAWQAAIGNKSYMMGISPWFFHSASGGADWVWRGDSLWADRWAQTLEVKPQFVECVLPFPLLPSKQIIK
jgi:glucan endo-1,3-alpha-glucosidase